MSAQALKRISKLEYGEALAQEIRSEGDVPVFGSNGIAGSHNFANTLAPAILVGRKGSFGKVLWTDVPGFCIDTAYFIDRRHTSTNLRWLYWALQTLGLDVHSEDTGVPGLSREKAYQSKLIVPSPNEQQRIANFLDDKTARIDALIAEKERLAESLIDAQDSEISRLVTEGCLLNAQMAISSIPWLPRYPAHWRLASLKHIVDVRDGTHETPVYVIQSDDSFPLVTSKDVSSGCLLFENTKHISREDYESIARRSGVSRGDLLMPMIGTVGGAVEVESDKKFAIKNLALFRTSASSCNTKWLQAVLNSQYVKTQFEYLRSGGVQGFVGLGELRGLRVPVPPPDEQKEIAGQITSVQLKYTPLVAHVHQHIERLREYRSSLISAAVTGQLEIN